jgi:hypothetical protein
MTDEDFILNATSVKSTFELLKKAIANPEGAPAALIDSCKSQGTLAALVLTEHAIRKMSLNTMKSHADSNPSISWEKLNTLRKAALSTYQKSQNNLNRPGRGSKTDLKDESEKAKQEVQVKNNEIIQFIDCYQDLLTICRDYSRLDSMFAAKFQKHLLKYSYLNQCNCVFR